MRSLALAVGLVVSGAASAVDVTVDLGTHYQRLEAWGGTPNMNPMSPALRDEMWDVLVEDLGLTRARLEPNRWEVDNDNGDPFALDASRLDTSSLDAKVTTHLLPFRQRVEARGDKFWL